MLTAATHRLRQAVPTVQATVAAHSTWRAQAVRELDGELDQTRHPSPLWRARDQLLRRVPGVGPTVSLTLLAPLPERGQGSVKHVATWVGLAPLTRASGAWRGTRAIWGGRRQVRAALSMAALVGVRYHPVLRRFSEGVLARGKPKQVALTACRHQLLTSLHAVVRDRTPWQPTLLTP
jgi:transposase